MLVSASVAQDMLSSSGTKRKSICDGADFVLYALQHTVTALAEALG